MFDFCFSFYYVTLTANIYYEQLQRVQDNLENALHSSLGETLVFSIITQGHIQH